MLRKNLNYSELKLPINDLKSKSVKSALFSSCSQIVSFLLTILSTVILARLLTPSDFGLIAIATIILLFLQLFADLGISTSILKQSRIRIIEITSLLYFNIFISFILCFIMYLSSSIMSNLYDNNQITLIIKVLSITFILNSIVPIYQSLLARQMKHKTITIINILSTFCTIVISIILAYYGYSYWALVINLLCLPLFKSIFYIWALKWFPKPKFKLLWINKHYNFAKNITYYKFINYFTRNLDTILIGKFYNNFTLGNYNKAYQLLLLPVQQLRQPIYSSSMPILSSLRNKPEEYSNYFLKMLMILTFLTSVFVGWLFLNSAFIINILLGEQWELASLIFNILVISAFIQPIEAMLGLLLVSLEKSKEYVIYGLIYFSIICFSFILGVNYDIEIFVTFYVIANYLSFIVSSFFVLPKTPVKIFDFFKIIIYVIPYFFIVSILIKHFVNNYSNDFFEFIIKTLLYILSIIIYLIINPKYYILIKDISVILKKKVKK